MKMLMKMMLIIFNELITEQQYDSLSRYTNINLKRMYTMYCKRILNLNMNDT